MMAENFWWTREGPRRRPRGVTGKTEFVMNGVDRAEKGPVFRALDLGLALAVFLGSHGQDQDARGTAGADDGEHPCFAQGFFGRDPGIVVRAHGHLRHDEPGRFDRAAGTYGLSRRRFRPGPVSSQGRYPGLGCE